MSYSSYKLECVSCKTQFKEEETATSCLKCGDPLDVIYDVMKQGLNIYALRNSPINEQKYLRFYPLRSLDKLVILNEGGTPLQKCDRLGKKFGLKNLHIKVEGANPTGVFKDRGSFVELTKAKVQQEIMSFHKKTNIMKHADLQYIIENVFKDVSDKDPVLVVKDYKIETTRHAKSKADVEVVFDGETAKSSNDGVGPVDALINAVKECLDEKNGLEFELTSYDVEIKTKGTNAVVEVHMGIKFEDTKVQASGTSPDIMVASVDAFEKAYNMLYYKVKHSL